MISVCTSSEQVGSSFEGAYVLLFDLRGVHICLSKSPVTCGHPRLSPLHRPMQMFSENHNSSPSVCLSKNSNALHEYKRLVWCKNEASSSNKASISDISMSLKAK